MPASLGGAVTFTTDRLPPSRYGKPGASDGKGNVLLSFGGSMSSTVMMFLSSDGRLTGTDESRGLELFPMSRGFQGAQNVTWSAPSVSRVLHYSNDGTSMATPYQNGEAKQVVDPSGGLKVLALATGELQSFDEQAQMVWHRRLPLEDEAGLFQIFDLSVDRLGNTLVVFDSSRAFGAGTVGGLWVDSSGNVGEAFQLIEDIDSSTKLRLYPAAEGGLLLGRVSSVAGDATAAWLGRLPDGAQDLAPAPGFLETRTEVTPIVVRGGHAYALIPPRAAGWQGGRCDVEIFDLEGNACGTLQLRETGLGCATISVGADGTVFAQHALTDEDCNYYTDEKCSWTWSWWPRLLK